MAKPESNVVVSAFTEDQVERLTGISQRQLRYWDRTGFFVPSLAYEDRRSPYSRLYSFRDIVSLKIVSALRNEANVPLLFHRPQYTDARKRDRAGMLRGLN
jgi:MerR-like DNA binding protein